MTSTKDFRDGWTNDQRRKYLTFIRDNPGHDGQGLVILYQHSHGTVGGDELGRALNQLNRERMIAYVPADGSEPTGELLPADPHVWVVTNEGTGFLAEMA